MSKAPKFGEFHDGKLWFQRKGSTITLGLTTLAVEELGSVQSISFPDDGSDYEKGEVLAVVDGTNGKLEVTTPATGIVTEMNEAAGDEPDVVTDDPFEEGWLVKLEVQDTSDLKEYATDDLDEG